MVCTGAFICVYSVHNFMYYHTLYILVRKLVCSISCPYVFVQCVGPEAEPRAQKGGKGRGNTQINKRIHIMDSMHHV